MGSLFRDLIGSSLQHCADLICSSELCEASNKFNVKFVPEKKLRNIAKFFVYLCREVGPSLKIIIALHSHTGLGSIGSQFERPQGLCCRESDIGRIGSALQPWMYTTSVCIVTCILARVLLGDVNVDNAFVCLKGVAFRYVEGMSTKVRLSLLESC